MNKLTLLNIQYALIVFGFFLGLAILWNNQVAIERLALMVAISALLFTLWWENFKIITKENKSKESLTVYKRNLLFKLIGTSQIIHWSLFSYLSYHVSMMYETTLRIGNMEVGNFQRRQFDSYKLYYDEIKYFTTSDVVPIEIKEKLDLLNLEAEKLINFLPVIVGKLNRTTFSRYINKLLEIVKWCIKNEDSDEICDHAKALLNGIENLLELTDMEDAIALEDDS